MTTRFPITVMTLLLALAAAAQAGDTPRDPMWANHDCYHGPDLVDCPPDPCDHAPQSGTVSPQKSGSAGGAPDVTTALAVEAARSAR